MMTVEGCCIHCTRVTKCKDKGSGIGGRDEGKGIGRRKG